MSRKGDCWDNAAMEAFFSSSSLGSDHAKSTESLDFVPRGWCFSALEHHFQCRKPSCKRCAAHVAHTPRRLHQCRDAGPFNCCIASGVRQLECAQARFLPPPPPLRCATPPGPPRCIASGVRRLECAQAHSSKPRLTLGQEGSSRVTLGQEGNRLVLIP
jgi:hypothetical protein